MKIRVRFAWIVVALSLVVGAVKADCPPVLFGYTTVYYRLVTCHGEGCVPEEQVVGECTLFCDGTTSCWGSNNCGGITHCRQENYQSCGPCTPDD